MMATIVETAMSTNVCRPKRRLLLQAALCVTFLGLITVSAGATMPVSGTPNTAAVPGVVRVWFYRVFFPEDTKDLPAISLNGSPVGYAGQGISFYRDIPAGQYHITVDTFGRDFNQSQDVIFTPGTEYYVKILSLPGWVSGTARNPYSRGTYYVSLVSQQVAIPELAQTTYLYNGY
jgi:hypothetical protein